MDKPAVNSQSKTTPPESKSTNETDHRSRVGMTWVALAAFTLILLLLAIFILQNSGQVEIKYFGAKGHLSFGVGMLLSALAGVILTLLIGSIRILQLRLDNKRQH
jgi:uncharacterized integral membrane protein